MTAFPMPAEDSDGVPSFARERRLAACPAAAAKYYQVKKQLLDFTAAMSPGSPVPPERELAKRYGTSRTTVRQALAELGSRDGCCACRAKGTFVAKPKVAQPLELASYTEGMRQHGLHPLTKILDIGYVTADEELAALLDVRPGGRLLRIHRLRLADGEPMSIDTSHLPAAGSPACGGSLSGTRRLYETLRTGYGIHLAEARRRSRPCLPTRTTPSCSTWTPASRCCCCRGTRSTPPASPWNGRSRGTAATATSSSPGSAGPRPSSTSA